MHSEMNRLLEYFCCCIYFLRHIYGWLNLPNISWPWHAGCDILAELEHSAVLCLSGECPLEEVSALVYSTEGVGLPSPLHTDWELQHSGWVMDQSLGFRNLRRCICLPHTHAYGLHKIHFLFYCFSPFDFILCSVIDTLVLAMNTLNSTC